MDRQTTSSSSSTRRASLVYPAVTTNPKAVSTNPKAVSIFVMCFFKKNLKAVSAPIGLCHHLFRFRITQELKKYSTQVVLIS
jgi:hypothetical protein